MYSHVTIGTNDLARAIVFYDAALAPLGLERQPVKWETWASWTRADGPEKFWVGQPWNQEEASHGNGWMVAFSAATRAMVDEAYRAGLAAGGTCEGPPGLRSFAPNYYGAYLRDPDGNKIHFVCRAEE